jgi:hypothetical protein
LLAFDRLYGLPDVYFSTAQTCAASLAPYAKRASKPGDFVPFFAAGVSRYQDSDTMQAMFGAVVRQQNAIAAGDEASCLDARSRE